MILFIKVSFLFSQFSQINMLFNTKDVNNKTFVKNTNNWINLDRINSKKITALYRVKIELHSFYESG